ncbi:MAG: peptidylprolyl isomerase [Pirellulales bacterium]|nr:peptidylprolyl isomerase [Pirellulales bacterium]
MRLRNRISFCRLWLAAAALALFAAPGSATVIRFQTVLGNYDVRLWPKLMPNSVNNMLSYVNANRYDGTFVHRSVPTFVIQGGGFTYNQSNNSAPPIATFPAIPDEPGNEVAGPSNVRGTIAMAKSGPDTVTSQWFINLGDNSELDSPARPDGGFSAFGRVLGSGMTVVDAIAALPRYNLDPYPQETFDTVPLRGANGDPLANRLVFVQDVRVLNVPDGDYNLDGKVDVGDLAVLEADWGSTTKAEADGNGDGRVNGADFLVWQRTLGQNLGAPTFAAVPEPAGLALAVIAALAVARRRARQ